MCKHILGNFSRVATPITMLDNRLPNIINFCSRKLHILEKHTVDCWKKAAIDSQETDRD